jgi:hypothetical protein
MYVFPVVVKGKNTNGYDVRILMVRELMAVSPQPTNCNSLHLHFSKYHGQTETR